MGEPFYDIGQGRDCRISSSALIWASASFSARLIKALLRDNLHTGEFWYQHLPDEQSRVQFEGARDISAEAMRDVWPKSIALTLGDR
jgi:hypothetical protein